MSRRAYFNLLTVLLTNSHFQVHVVIKIHPKNPTQLGLLLFVAQVAKQNPRLLPFVAQVAKQ
jgi:hypothetical protein